jgi:hypothetical protein
MADDRDRDERSKQRRQGSRLEISRPEPEPMVQSGFFKIPFAQWLEKAPLREVLEWVWNGDDYRERLVRVARARRYRPEWVDHEIHTHRRSLRKRRERQK